MSNSGLDRRIFDLEEELGLTLPKDADLPAECPSESCSCMDDDIIAVAREILEEVDRQQILKDIANYNREYYFTHFTDGTPIVVNQNDGMIVLGAV